MLYWVFFSLRRHICTKSTGGMSGLAATKFDHPTMPCGVYGLPSGVTYNPIHKPDHNSLVLGCRSVAEDFAAA